MKYHSLFLLKIRKDVENLSSAAVVIGALRVNSYLRFVVYVCCIYHRFRNKKNERKIVNIYLPISLNICFGAQKTVIFLPAHPASFTHNFCSGMQSFYFNESQYAMVLQTGHEKIVFWTHKFAVGLICMGNSESQDP